MYAKANSTGSHRLAGQARAVFTSATEVHVTKDGNDTYNNGTVLFPYLTIARGFEDVTATRCNVIVGPGEFEETTTLVWPTVAGVKLIGSGNMWQTVIIASAGDQVINVAPGVQTGTFNLSIQNVQLEHSNGQDGLLLNNTSMTAKLNCYLGHVGMDGESDDFSLLVTHTDTDNAVRIYWDGDNGGVAGSIDLNGANAGDRFYAKDIAFTGDAFAFGGDIASTVRIEYCRLTYRFFTGGGAASTVVGLFWCTTLTGTTYASVIAADVTTNSDVNTPTIVGTT